ncbi:lipoprotein LprJ [Mycobacterium triplex]|nr:lipoprotein LprJ [Mycobacterium triplex]
MMLLSVASTIALAVPAHADPSPSPSPAPDPAADANFLKELKDAGLTFSDPAAAISAGKTVCELVDAGHSDQEIVNNLQLRNPGFAENGAAKFTAIAAGSYCPKYLTGEGRGPKPEGAVGD